MSQNLAQVPSISTAPAPHSDCTVLVVDDDDELREALAELLQDEGLEVAMASNGLEALDYLRSHEPPHVMLLDLMMPKMSGPELRAEMLGDESLSGIPVIVLSAAHDGRTQAAALRAAGYFSKPVRLEKLVDAVRAHC